MERNGFLFYRSFYEALKDLDDKQYAKIHRAVCEYALNGQETELDGVEKALFSLIKPSLDVSIKNYLNGCKNKVKTKPNESETKANGKPNESETITNGKPIKMNNKDIDKDKDIYKDKDKDKDKEKEKNRKESESSSDFLSLIMNLYEIQPDISNINLARDLDFKKVLKAWGESKWLKDEIKSLRWITNNYQKIIRGDYKDKARAFKEEEKQEQRPVPEGKPADYWEKHDKMIKIIKDSWSGDVFDMGLAHWKGLELDYIDIEKELPCTLEKYKSWNGLR